MANIISVIQTKGGTGKTTTSMFLATALHHLGDQVIVFDADKQRSATDWAEDVGGDFGFEVKAVPTERTLQSAVDRYNDSNVDFILIDTPPGSNSIVDIASKVADLVLIPTGVSPLDMKRTQATLDVFDGTEIPVAVVLVNVDKRERLLDLAQETLSVNTRAALADTIIPTRSATRRAGSTVPNIARKAFQEWIDLAQELKEAF
ncbi:ParA family protein [Corynebacterium sp. H128]|uniref:ParA family protein n=1 Tax=unclassified Corynebacterium TaxID=2624378 RepID=UPI0030987D41